MTTLSSTLSVPLELSSPHGHLPKEKGEKKCLMFSVFVWGWFDTSVSKPKVLVPQLLSSHQMQGIPSPQSVSLFSSSKMENTSLDHDCCSGWCVLPFTTITIINNKTSIPAGDGLLISPHLAFSAGRCQEALCRHV